MIKVLNSKDVYRKSILRDKIKNTSELDSLEDILVGQDKAKESLRYGLSISDYGYNIFVTGEKSSKKKEYLKKVLESEALKKNVPDDMVYVNNFEKENNPVLIRFSTGEGSKFKKDVEDFAKFAKEELVKYFSSNNYSKELELVEQKYEYELYELSREYESKFAETNFMLSITAEGYMAIPLNQRGKVFTEKKLNKYIAKNEKKYMEDKNKFNAIVLEMIHAESDIHKEKELEISEFDKNKVSEIISEYIEDIIKKYNQDKVTHYMNSMKDYIIENLNIFKFQEESRVVDANGNLVVVQDDENLKYEEYFNKTFVNLIIDNKDLDSAPVIFAKNIDEYSLFGGVVYNTDMRLGINSTDFSKIIPGDLVKANGGYIVIDIEDLLSEDLWINLKRVIKNGEIKFTSRLSNGVMFSDSVESEAIPMDLKVILVGDEYLYYYLLDNDWDFKELFQIHSKFDVEIDRNEDTEFDYARLLATYCRANNMKELTGDAVGKLIEYSSRLSGEKNKLLLYYSDIYKVLIESNSIAIQECKDFIYESHIETALKNQRDRVDIATKRLIERETEGMHIVTVKGERVGEVNALHVMDYREFSVGGLSKITANTYASKGYGVISVDKDAEMSGPLHNKCISIIRGFLGERFAKREPISLTVNISFEQSYFGIDGDSATLAETCAILSNLSGVPIKQNIGITGSMNQKGEAQCIGGVNDKIEGFYRVCKYNNSLEGASVIIPNSNVFELMLSDDVIKAVEDGVFKIYTVETIEDAVELLTGVKYEDIESRISL